MKEYGNKKNILIISITMIMILVSGCMPGRYRYPNPDPRYLTFTIGDNIYSWSLYANPELINCGGKISHGWKIFEVETKYPLHSSTKPSHQTAPFVRPTFLMRVDEGTRWWLIKAEEKYYLLDQEKGGRIKRVYKKEKLPNIDAIGITGKIKIGSRDAQYIDTDAATDLFPLDGIICSDNQWGFLIQPGSRFWIRLDAHSVGRAHKHLIGESENINDLVEFVQDRNPNVLKIEKGIHFF